MTLFAQYIKERENKEIIENDYGFVTYFFLANGDCYIEDVYIIPEKRRTKLASEFGQQVELLAKECGSKKVLGSVDINANNKTESMKFLLSYGFKLCYISGSLIYLSKEL
jgi:hypothetical protein